MPQQNRVVIAGMGLYHAVAGEGIAGGDPDIQNLLPGINVRAVNRQSIFAGVAVRQAIATYLERDVLKPERTGVVMGSTFGAVASIDHFYSQALQEGVNAVSPMEFPNTVANAPTSRVGIWFQFKGPNVTLSDGLVSGLDAVGHAYDEIRYQKADFYIAGDTEEISANILRGYAETSRQGEGAAHPLAETIGEGAGGFYLSSWEAAQAADYRIYAEIAGFYSGPGRQIFSEVDLLLNDQGMRREDTMIYTSLQPFNPAAGRLLEEAGTRFGIDRLITPNCEGGRTFQYFGLNGIISVIRAASDCNAARRSFKGAVVLEADWGGRAAAVLLKMPESK